ncbi:MAG: SPOR domain-containing protein [Planctomycetota bacterium]
MKKGTLRIILINLLAPVIGGILVMLAGCDSPTPSDIVLPTPTDFQAAQDLYNQRKYDQCYDACTNYLNAHSDQDAFYAQANLLAGRSASKLENYSVAVMRIDRAIHFARTPADEAAAKIAMGDTYFDSGAYDLAISQYQNVLAYHEGEAGVQTDALYFKLGMANKFLPNTAEADKYFELIMDEFRHGAFFQMARREDSRIGNNDDPLKFYLAIGEYSSKGEAQDVVDALDKKGYTAGIQELAAKDTGLHVFRVALENFETPSDARVVQRRLASENISSTLMP